MEEVATITNSIISSAAAPAVARGPPRGGIPTAGAAGDPQGEEQEEEEEIRAQESRSKGEAAVSCRRQAESRTRRGSERRTE